MSPFWVVPAGRVREPIAIMNGRGGMTKAISGPVSYSSLMMSYTVSSTIYL